MRKLNTADLFCAARAVKASGLRSELQNLLLNVDPSNIRKVGIDTILTVIEAFADKGAEKLVYEFLSGPFEMNIADIAKLDLEQLLDILTQFAEDGGLAVFFERLSGILGRN